MCSTDYGFYMSLVEDLSNTKVTSGNKIRIERLKREIDEYWIKLNDYEKTRGLELEKKLRVL